MRYFSKSVKILGRQVFLSLGVGRKQYQLTTVHISNLRIRLEFSILALRPMERLQDGSVVRSRRFNKSHEKVKRNGTEILNLHSSHETDSKTGSSTTANSNSVLRLPTQRSLY